MEPVAGIFPRQDVAQGPGRPRRPALGEQVADFVLPGRVADARGVLLHPGQMTDGTESSFSPRGHELVDPGPSVEGGTNGVRLQDAMDFPEGRQKPIGIVVVHAPPPVTRAVVDEVGRVGDDQIHTFAGHGPHDCNAIAANDLAEKGADGFRRGLVHRLSMFIGRGVKMRVVAVCSRGIWPDTLLRAGYKERAWMQSAIFLAPFVPRLSPSCGRNRPCADGSYPRGNRRG